MIVGLPKEIKDNENRVGLVPAGVKALTSAGHEVFVEHDAGVGSGIPDEQYVAAGAKILATADEVFGKAGMIVKVKEPVGPEYQRLREGQILYTYLHLAPGQGADGHAPRAQGRGRGVRDDHGRERLAAAAHADVRSGRPHERARGRVLPPEVQRRPRHPALRRARSRRRPRS